MESSSENSKSESYKSGMGGDRPDDELTPQRDNEFASATDVAKPEPVHDSERNENPPAREPSAGHSKTRSPLHLIVELKTSAVFVIIGLALVVLTVPLYPRRHAISLGQYTTIDISSVRPNKPIGPITYIVAPGPGSLQNIAIKIGTGTVNESIQIGVLFGNDSSILKCPRQSGCGSDEDSSYWSGEITTDGAGPLGSGVAVAEFEVQANDLNYSDNGLNSAVVLPEVSCEGNNVTAGVEAEYKFPNAGHYDWSDAPYVGDKVATWNERLSDGFVQQASESGVDSGTQQRDNFRIFLAGALIALAGSAFLAAIQERLHEKSNNTTRQ